MKQTYAVFAALAIAVAEAYVPCSVAGPYCRAPTGALALRAVGQRPNMATVLILKIAN